MSIHPTKSLRAAFAALVLVVLAAIALLAFAAAANAATCAGKRQLWTVNGRSLCLKTARPATGHASFDADKRLARWVTLATAAAKKGKLKRQAKLLAAAPKVSSAGAALLARASKPAGWTHARKLLRTSGFTVGSSHGEVVEAMSESSPTIKLDNGAELSANIEGRAFADGAKDFKLTLEVKRGQDRLEYQPMLDTLDATVPEAGCPSADGTVKIDYTTRVGGTLMGFHGTKVLGAATMKSTTTLHARGHVGRDAKLHDVDSDVTVKNESYTRGLQAIVTTSGSYNIPREGNPSPTGPLSASVNVRAAGYSAAEEREAEKQLATSVAADKDNISGLGSLAELGRWRMMQDEYKWYRLPNGCADIRYSPDTIAKLAAGKTVAVKGVVRATSDGGEASGEFTVQSVSRGSFTATKSQSDPGSPAQFTATGASPNADKQTVASDLIATSTAGRAQWGWYAEDDLGLPDKLSGTISSTSTMPGDYTYFHAWATYALDSVYVSDSGYVSAFYKLTKADMDEAQHDIGSGCRWVGKGSGGEIADGDIELRKPPGGTYQYAVMYDVEIANTTYVPTDCGAAPMDPLTMDLVGFVNMAMLGGGFQDVGDKFHMEAILSHTDAASGRKTVADWNFDPGDPQ